MTTQCELIKVYVYYVPVCAQIFGDEIEVKSFTVTPDLFNTGLSDNLIYRTLCCESPLLPCVLFTLIYPTPGLSDTWFIQHLVYLTHFMRNKHGDKPGLTMYLMSISINHTVYKNSTVALF